MADYTELKAAIRAAIFDNTEQAITGESLQEILVQMVDELGESYVLPEGGIPASDLAQAVRDALAEAVSAYQLPEDGIPEADLAQAVRNALAAGLSAYQKPSTGIPKTDLSRGVQNSLDKADEALTQNDIADNLTTDDATKVLSAKQGVVLAGQVSQLGQEITDFSLPIIEGKSVGLGGTIGATINLTPQTENGWNCVVFQCAEGDSFTISGTGGNSTRLWGFVDSDNKLISVSSAGLSETNLKVIAPENSFYFVANSHGSLTVICRKSGSLPDVNESLDNRVNALEAGTGVNAVPFVIQNGSQGNSGNAWVVTLRGQQTGYAIPVTAGKRYKLVINKQAENGYNFYYRFVTYSVINPQTLSASTVRNNTNDWNNYNQSGDEILINSGEVGITFQLTELTSPGSAQAVGTCIALRASDFAAGDITLVELPASAPIQYMEAVAGLGGSVQNLTIDQNAKTVKISSYGLRVRTYNKVFELVGSADFVMSYDSADFSNGGWMLLRSAVESVLGGGTIELNSTNVFFANVNTKAYRDNILLFATYYGRIYPSGLLGGYIAVALAAGISADDIVANAFNSVYNDANITDKCKQFSALFNNSGVGESLVYMTDPHLLGSNNVFNETTFKNYIGLLQKYYNMLPVDWMVCGGDWLNSGDYQADACWKLGYADATMRKLFKHYYPILGNHDINYQGTVSAGDSNRGDLTHQALVNLMFRANGNTYYEWNGNNTRFFVLDTQTDWESSMDSFKWGQVDWLANKLFGNTEVHIVLLMHIYYNSGTTIGTMASNIQTLAGAFNSRSNITLNGITYDFTSAQGKIHCIIAGHSHTDHIVTDSSVPVWITTNMTDGSTPTFDLLFFDYTAGKLLSVRVGTGSNREMNLAI